jgi:type I restriction enzyme S subunit
VAVKAGYKRTAVGVIPEDWRVAPLASYAKGITDGEHATPMRTSTGYYLLSARNILNGRIDLRDVDFVGAEEYRRIRRRCNPESGDVLISCSGTVGRVAVVPDGLECVMVRSAALVKPDPIKLSGRYAQYFLQSSAGQDQIAASLNQGAQANLFLGQIGKLRIALPPTKAEQEAIAETLSDADALVDSVEQLLAKKRHVQQGAMQMLLTGKIRLPGFDQEWRHSRVRDLLFYERPDRYIVRSTEYSERGDTPVLTANKSFILGYTVESFGICRDLPAIVFDDFTTASKYVDFPFKVKSSAIKLLRPKHDQVHLRFVCDRMQLIRFPLGDHKRHYISEFQNLEMAVPDHTEQHAVAVVLSDIHAEVTALEARLAKARQLKQGMMQDLLTGKIRLV